MKEDVSSRHSASPQDGVRVSSDEYARPVKISISHADALDYSNQLTVAVIINLLARMATDVVCIELDIPNAKIQGRISPLLPDIQDLQELANETIQVIDVVQRGTGLDPIRIAIGNQPTEVADIYVRGAGWVGGVSSAPISFTGCNLSFGPMVAASLAVAEVFKLIRLEPDAFKPLTSAYFSIFDMKGSILLPRTDHLEPENFRYEGFLAGTGAVGCAALYTLWASPNLTVNMEAADFDPEGFTISNLNRYMLQTRQMIGQPKASTLGGLLHREGFQLEGNDVGVERIQPKLGKVMSAVDKNSARAALQNWFPESLVGASTLGLRVQLLRSGPLGTGSCLRCYSPPEAEKADDTIRQELHANPELSESLAIQFGLSKEEIHRKTASGQCSTVSSDIISSIRSSDEVFQEFAVGFVSCFAGVLLAAESLLDRLTGEQNRLSVQLVDAGSTRSQPQIFLRDPRCPSCQYFASVNSLTFL